MGLHGLAFIDHLNVSCNMKFINILTAILLGCTLIAAQTNYQKKIICPKEGINIRTGPGTNYSKDPSGQLFKGESIYILDEKDGWLKFRVTPANLGWSGWVLKRLVMPTKEASKVYRSRQKVSPNSGVIRDLKISGFLITLKIDLNEAWVDPSMWHNMTYDTKKGACIILAKECEFAGSTDRIVIKDSYTGKKLAK